MSTPNLIEISFCARDIQVCGLYRLDKHISSIWTLFLVKLKQDSVLFRVLFRRFSLYLYHWSKRMSCMFHLDRYHIWNNYHPSWEYPYVISAYLHRSCEFESRTWRGVLHIILCEKVCQWLATGQWFSPGTLIFSTNKNDCHDIAEILLKSALHTTTLTPLEHIFLFLVFVTMLIALFELILLNIGIVPVFANILTSMVMT